MAKYVNLHLHSMFSLKDGTIRIPENPKKEGFPLGELLKSRGETACALTDHGNMIGTLAFYKACKAFDIKPIIGCEVYVAPWGDSMLNKSYKKKKKNSDENETTIDENTDNENIYNHLILLAKNLNGYRNLCKIVSLGYTEGFYKKPRVDFEVLKKYHEDLVCSSACLAGVIPQTLLNDSYEKAKQIAQEYKNLFGEDYYLEVQDHGQADEKKVNPLIFKLAEELNIKTVATNDAHFLNKEDYIVQDIVVTAGYKQTLHDENRTWKKYYDGPLGPQNYVKSEEEMLALFPDHPEAVYNTVEVADKCNVNLEETFMDIAAHDSSQMHLPQIPYDTTKYASQEEYFKDLVMQGMHERYGENLSPDLLDRLEKEFNTIIPMGFVNYFLVVSDYCKWAKDNNVPIGPSRGSGGGSIVCYALRITEIDPVQFDLLFDRFLNPERISLPDIDTDMADKDAVYRYAQEKYGVDNVCHVLNLSILKSRSALQEVARILEFTPKESDEITKMIPEGAIDITLKEALQTVPALKARYNEDARFKELYDDAMLIEGIPNHTGVHASAIIIADKPVSDYAPLLLTEKTNMLCIQFQGVEIEELGLIKMDFLGLNNLTFIKDSLTQIAANRNISIDFSKLNLFANPEVYRTLRQDTLGVFQFESAGMGGLLRDCLFDIDRLNHITSDEERNNIGREYFNRMVAAIALYRPGPMEHIPSYISGMRDSSTVTFDTKEQKEVLSDTYGIMVYQEQIMQLCQKMAGFTFGRADIIRRGIAKKHIELVTAEKENFINGCINNGISKEIAVSTWKLIEDGSGYSFNKSHAVGYSIVAYETAFLKHFFLPEFMAAVLSNTDGDDLKRYISACKNSLGLKISHPDINRSEEHFVARIIDENNPVVDSNGQSITSNFEIIFGFAGINGISKGFITPLVEERAKNGPFTTFEEFITRTKDFLSSDVLINLIKSGCFDSLDSNRFKLEYNAKKLLTNIKKKIQQDEKLKMRQEAEDAKALAEGRKPKEVRNRFKPLDLEMSEIEDLSIDEKAFREKEACNMFFEYNPLSKFQKTLHSLPQAKTVREVISNPNIKRGTFIVVLSYLKKKTSKRSGKMFATCTISDLTGEIEGIIYENVLNSQEAMLREDRCLCIKGTVKDDRGKPIISIQEVFDPTDPNLKARVMQDNNNFRTPVGRARSEQIYDISKQDIEPGLHIQIASRLDLNKAVDFFYPFRGKTNVYFYVKEPLISHDKAGNERITDFSQNVYSGPVQVNIEDTQFMRELKEFFGEENIILSERKRPLPAQE